MTWEWFFSNIIMGGIAIILGFSPIWLIVLFAILDDISAADTTGKE